MKREKEIILSEAKEINFLLKAINQDVRSFDIVTAVYNRLENKELKNKELIKEVLKNNNSWLVDDLKVRTEEEIKEDMLTAINFLDWKWLNDLQTEIIMLKKEKIEELEKNM